MGLISSLIVGYSDDPREEYCFAEVPLVRVEAFEAPFAAFCLRDSAIALAMSASSWLLVTTFGSSGSFCDRLTGSDDEKS